MRVLIVDDNPPIRAMIRAMLERHGCQIVGEADGMKATVEAYQAHKPDIVTLDLSLANVEENGLTVLKALRRIDSRANVLIIAATAQGKMVEMLRQAGASGYLAKPFNYEELVQAVEAARRG